MNLQETLSQNALSHDELAAQRQQEEERAIQADREEADRQVHQLIVEIEKQLVEKVQKGDYTKEYNKGQVKCFVKIPQNKYLRSPVSTQYRKDYTAKKSTEQYLVDENHKREYQYVRDALDSWAKRNRVTLSWTVRREDCWYERPFPSYESYEIGSHDWGHKLELAIKVVSCFPVNPELPMEHMTDNDQKDKQEKLQARIRRLEEQRKKEMLWLLLGSTIIVLCVLFFILSLIDEESPAIFIFSFVIWLPLTYALHSSYRSTCEALENAKMDAGIFY